MGLLTTADVRALATCTPRNLKALELDPGGPPLTVACALLRRTCKTFSVKDFIEDFKYANWKTVLYCSCPEVFTFMGLFVAVCDKIAPIKKLPVYPTYWKLIERLHETKTFTEKIC